MEVPRPRTALHALAAFLFVSTTTLGADQPVLGKKLLIKDPPSGSLGNKLVLLAKDASITLGAAGSAGDPQCTGAGGGGGSLRILASDGAGDVTIPLPCAGWTTNAANTIYKYKDETNGTCTLVLVKSGKLAKAVCKGSQVAIDVNAAMSPVAVVTTLNGDAFCTEFGGTVVQEGADDETFLRRDAPPPVGCASTTTSSSSSSSTTTSSTTTSTAPSCPAGAHVVGGVLVPGRVWPGLR